VKEKGRYSSRALAKFSRLGCLSDAGKASSGYEAAIDSEACKYCQTEASAVRCRGTSPHRAGGVGARKTSHRRSVWAVRPLISPRFVVRHTRPIHPAVCLKLARAISGLRFGVRMGTDASRWPASSAVGDAGACFITDHRPSTINHPATSLGRRCSAVRKRDVNRDHPRAYRPSRRDRVQCTWSTPYTFHRRPGSCECRRSEGSQDSSRLGS
jgi:hypothetical protein